MNDMVKTPTAPARSRDVSPMGRLRGEIDRLFDAFWRPSRDVFDFATRSRGPVPALELNDGGKAYSLTAELPGLSDKNVTLEVADGVLTIAGKKNEQSETKDGGCLMTKRRYGAFRQQMTLPADADAEAVEAKIKVGVLTVTIGKDAAAPTRARKIEIQS